MAIGVCDPQGREAASSPEVPAQGLLAVLGASESHERRVGGRGNAAAETGRRRFPVVRRPDVPHEV
eukprot:5854513-Pyramimonas_sp.AAC.1